jgi:hypothetical protein
VSDADARHRRDDYSSRPVAPTSARAADRNSERARGCRADVAVASVVVAAIAERWGAAADAAARVLSFPFFFFFFFAPKGTKKKIVKKEIWAKGEKRGSGKFACLSFLPLVLVCWCWCAVFSLLSCFFFFFFFFFLLDFFFLSVRENNKEKCEDEKTHSNQPQIRFDLLLLDFLCVVPHRTHALESHS